MSTYGADGENIFAAPDEQYGLAAGMAGQHAAVR